MCPECALGESLADPWSSANAGQARGNLSDCFQRSSRVPPPFSDQWHRRKEASKCFSASSPGPSLSAPRPSRSRAVPTGSSAPPPAAAQLLLLAPPPLPAAAHPLPAAAPAAGVGD